MAQWHDQTEGAPLKHPRTKSKRYTRVEQFPILDSLKEL